MSETSGYAAGTDEASCAVRKDAGDDPDTTDGILILRQSRFFSEEKGVHLVGGAGVGPLQNQAFPAK